MIILPTRVSSALQVALVGCPDADTLAALVADALAESERAEIAVHAASCSTCHALLAGLLETADSGDGTRRAAATLGEGTRIGRYVLGERLGAGGMGVVYAATDSELHRRVAVKLLRADGTGELSTQGRERMMREARVLASLSHPNVVTVFDVGTHGDNVFLAMELVEGGNLAAWVREGKHSLAEILDRLIDAGRGLAAAHAAGVVHRDVKPDNILVGRDGRARVTDFGLARLERAPEVPAGVARGGSEELTREGTQMGTPVYMAPEQRAAGEVGPRADQWSFCAMIYELVAGVRPFRIEDPDERATAITAGRITPPRRKIPRWLVRVVARGLRAEPNERWDSIDELVAALVRGRRRPARIARTIGLSAVAVVALGGVAIAKHRSAPVAKLDSPELRMIDPRAGCSCPMSACTNTCVSVCRSSEYDVSSPIPGISIPGRQEALQGVSGDGEQILFLANKRCNLDHLWLAHRHGDAYESVDVTDQLDRSRVLLFEGCCTLAADGKSMILANSERRGFVRVPLPIGSAPLEDLGTLITDGPASATVRFPVLSADERTLYYRVIDWPVGAPDAGPLDGIYSSVRSDRQVAFVPGTRLPGRARHYDYPTGVSSDGLSLFVEGDYRTHVLVRASTDQAFNDPGEGMLPALLPGWRAAPLTDCRRIATTWTPGGCEREDIVFLEAR